MTAATDQNWRTCIRPQCGTSFLLGPGLDRDSRGRAVFCCEECKRREASAVQRAAWTELARRHRAEFLAIRREITRARRA